jgi:hypothetical protein
MAVVNIGIGKSQLADLREPAMAIACLAIHVVAWRRLPDTYACKTSYRLVAIRRTHTTHVAWKVCSPNMKSLRFVGIKPSWTVLDAGCSSGGLGPTHLRPRRVHRPVCRARSSAGECRPGPAPPAKLDAASHPWTLTSAAARLALRRRNV